MIKLAHGIRAAQGGRNTMGALRDELRERGRDAGIVSYGYVLVPITNKQAVNAVLDGVVDGDTVYAYSNGAWAAVQAAELGLAVRHLILINPALHKAREFPGHIERIDVFYSPGDGAVQKGKWWRWTTRILPWRWRNPHGWGEMGRTGYTGNDPRVRNHEMPEGVGHYWYEDEDCVRQAADAVERD